MDTRARVLEPGSTAVIRGMFRGRPCYAWAVRVLDADDAQVLTARWPGTATRDITSYIESLSGDTARRAEVRLAHARGDWELADSAWRWTGVVEQVVTGRWFAVSRMFDGDGRLRCWYVNFERPPAWRPGGYETHDLALDLVVEPGGAWHWKDEDEYAQYRRLGLITDQEDHAVRAAREEAVALVEAGAGVFAADPAERWLPDPAWPLPRLT